MARLSIIFCFVFLLMPLRALVSAQPLTIRKEEMFLGGTPFRILSGEMHYCRIPEPYWKDRLQKARAMGLNTICTYVFWNIHEPNPGEFTFDGNLNVARFIKEAQEEGLYVILRPGPYVCSEWDFGGLPAWLLKDPEMKVRCMYQPYLDAARRYLIRLGAELRDLQSTRGGPIIAVQVENEYGSYGNDKEYMRWVDRTLRDAGFDVQFTTSDGSDAAQLESGALDDALAVVNFGSQPEKNFANLAAFRANQPQMCGEYWTGWFTQWGQKEWGGANLAAQATEVRWMIENGKSFNMYMVHGGTNFGFYAGANFFDGKYYADVTSYDYGSPISEDGLPTKSYMVYRELLRQYQPAGTRLPDLPAPLPTIALADIRFGQTAPLFANLTTPVQSIQPRPMESYGQNLGYILYRTKLVGPKQGKLEVTDLHDFAYVYVNGGQIGTIDRRKGKNSVTIPRTDKQYPELDILLEALGRVNFGPALLDRKGITERAVLEGVTLTHWEVFLLPMESDFLNSIKFAASDSTSGPRFFKGNFATEETGDTFLDLTKWKKGVVWVNGHNLGRYWPSAGPQHDLYVPGCWLKKGSNEIIVFDLERSDPAPLRTTRSRQ